MIVIHRLTREHCRVQAIKLSYSSVGMETEHPHTLFKRDGVSATVNTATYGKGKSPLPMGPPTVRRDLDLEWKLIAREEPERARLVRSQIDWLLAHR